MDRDIDNMDKALYEYVSSINFDGFSKEEIHNIATRAKRKKKIGICQCVALFSFFILISMATITFYINYTNNNIYIYSKINNDMGNKISINEEEKLNAELFIKENENIEKKEEIDIVIYKANTDVDNIYSAGCFAEDPSKVYVPIENVSRLYIIKVEKILESSFVAKTPTTKFKASIINSIKGQDSGEIEITSNGGIVSIYDIEKSDLNIKLDNKYSSLSDIDKKNTFVRLISDFDYNQIEEPIVGKIYIVSLDENNKVISNCDYPLLEFNLESNLYKTRGNQWKKFNY